MLPALRGHSAARRLSLVERKWGRGVFSDAEVVRGLISLASEKKIPRLTDRQKDQLDRRLDDFHVRFLDKMTSSFGESIADRAFSRYRKDLINIDDSLLNRVGGIEKEDLMKMLDSDDPEEWDGRLYSGVYKYVQSFHRKDFEKQVQERGGSDLRQPHQLYPMARALKRRITYHHGPTNSGKTYTAMQALKKAKSGVYAGPLRLLALECYEKLNRQGVHTNLLTGQEKRKVPFATHLSCTVEILPLHQEYDVVVIDEIQLIADVERGSSWTSAVLGAIAKEVHVCGDGTARELMKDLAELCGDDYEEFGYERRTPLTPLEYSLNNDYTLLQPGDAVIAFARESLFEIRNEIETETNYKCCVIYGALPPETRARQARLFNDPENRYEILVATDAVGMGLNLNIGRVVFAKTTVVIGQREIRVPHAHIRQIAGRAGRDGTRFPTGYATAMTRPSLDYLHESFNTPPVMHQKAGMLPSFEQMEEFALSQPASEPLSVLLGKYSAVVKLEKRFALCNDKLMDFKEIAELMEEYEHNLSMQEKFHFLLTPINSSNEILMKNMKRYIREFAEVGFVRLYENGIFPRQLSGFGRTTITLSKAEAHCQILDCYIYAGLRLGSSAFVDLDLAVAIRNEVVLYIDTLLWEARYVRKKDAENAERLAGESLGSSDRRGGNLDETHQQLDRPEEWTRNNE